MSSHPKRPRDPNQLAKAVIDLATMDEAERAELHRKIATKSPSKKKTHKPGKRSSST